MAPWSPPSFARSGDARRQTAVSLRPERAGRGRPTAEPSPGGRPTQAGRAFSGGADHRSVAPPPHVTCTLPEQRTDQRPLKLSMTSHLEGSSKNSLIKGSVRHEGASCAAVGYNIHNLWFNQHVITTNYPSSGGGGGFK